MSRESTHALQPGTLYVVATPIGHLGDISVRATQVLHDVDVIAAEDTRHTRGLLNHLGVGAPRLLSLHEHNETRQLPGLVRLLQSGGSVALVSDAGTPLISDPGYRLVSKAGELDIPVIAVPGPSAVTAALSISGLPTDRFVFEGFLPARAEARRTRLQSLSSESRTLVFFESPKRVPDALSDIADIFGEDRLVALCRELTKRFESVQRAPAGELSAQFRNLSEKIKGEIVLVVKGTAALPSASAIDEELLIELLADALPPRRASEIAARLTGGRKNDFYKRILKTTDAGSTGK
ncbi:MAG TPA: 16S rRNA (cytidine(1402)-2'-O)-methyltransferase [Gammaproteobacteria bacterium]|nr:16S rRNA (cytidine(1402)-2'-O)-methyltransferase [Acidiferrobacteraceae bacterium]MDP6397392.1 16S rRNA (cytidine(1402)-2'-O)-methyltransferase [Arenicellales bacterium]HCX87178.1 16S rRNA (cytidine(1402)-2'-O)-methyltransferase [Gammaproteobacteria bacterium]MDP6551736.1 16S rRNA (cytidine(1402)-2'-O)-methyltransferase [Arenicellales bacterium]MDP6791474.1 16S rRNA (cytidine(1402)-2'-O)-methyltransferase [Arenicellales bacterium]